MLAIIVGIFVGSREAGRRGMDQRHFNAYWITAIPIALICAFLNGVLFFGGLSNALKAISDPAELFSGGLVSFGAVLGLLGWGFVLARIQKQPVGTTLDTISLMLPLILGIYRIGCILNGCCDGAETGSAIGLYLPNVYGVWAVRYPTQLMYMAFDFGLFALLWQWRLRKPKEGNIILAFLLSFSIFRFMVDGLRDLPKVLDNLNLHQLASLAILLITLYFMLELRLVKSSSKTY